MEEKRRIVEQTLVGTERDILGYQTRNLARLTCSSLPFGDALSCTSGDPSTLHFTGKERDSESGLDNFIARQNSTSFRHFDLPRAVQCS